jgi:T5SS/PEP-CTERM-associated repeat protein
MTTLGLPGGGSGQQNGRQGSGSAPRQRVRILRESAALTMLLAAISARASDYVSTWDGATDAWSNSAHWSAVPVPADPSDTVPNNSVLGTYDAFINSGTANFDLTHVTINTLTLGQGGSGSTLTIPSGSLTVNDVTYVAYSGNGTVIHQGGSFASESLVLALLPSSNGTYQMTGAGTSLQASIEYIGQGGQANFSQQGGSNEVLHGGEIYIGSASGSQGTYTLSGGGSLTTSGLTVGVDGIGTFSQSDSASEVTMEASKTSSGP